MIPYKSNVATAEPKDWGVRLVIIGAIRRLKEQSDYERRVEIASLRHELQDIAQHLRKIGRELPLLLRLELRKAVSIRMSLACRQEMPTEESGRTTAAVRPTNREFSRMRPIADGYRARNMLPTGTIGAKGCLRKGVPEARSQKGL